MGMGFETRSAAAADRSSPSLPSQLPAPTSLSTLNFHLSLIPTRFTCSRSQSLRVQDTGPDISRAAVGRHTLSTRSTQVTTAVSIAVAVLHFPHS